MVLSYLLQSIVVDLAQLKLDLVQSCQHSIQILNEFVANGLGYLQAFRLTHYLGALQHHVGCFLDVIQVLVDFFIFVIFESSDAAIQDIHIFTQLAGYAFHGETIVISESFLQVLNLHQQFDLPFLGSKLVLIDVSITHHIVIQS
jgi:hypothetical protein